MVTETRVKTCTRLHVFPESAVRLHSSEVHPRTFPRDNSTIGLARHIPQRTMQANDESDLRHEIFGVRRRVLSPPSNLGSSTVRHVSATTAGLFGSSLHIADYGRLDVFCSPRRIRGGNFAHRTQMQGVVTLAERSGLMDGGEDVRRTEIFNTPRRIRSANPEALEVRKSRSAGPRLLSAESEASNKHVLTTKSAMANRSKEDSESGKPSSRTSESLGLSKYDKDEISISSGVESPRTLRKTVPEYYERYESNLNGSTLATPACEGWRGVGMLGGPSPANGHFCSRDPYPPRKKEESWRVLVASLYQQSLPSEAREILLDFESYAEELEKSVDERLSDERRQHEETWRKQWYASRLKPSAYLLKLRVVEKRLAKSQEYSEAAVIKREADQKEKLEMLEHEKGLERKFQKLDGELRAREELTMSKARTDLYEQLWHRILNGDIPAP